MKLQSPSISGAQVIAGLGPGWVEIAGRRYTRSLLLSPAMIDPAWGPDSFATLAEAHLAALLEHRGEVLLLGTGARQHLLPPQRLRPFIERGISLEVMDSAAACRTYNLLAAENRAVLAALIVESER